MFSNYTNDHEMTPIDDTFCWLHVLAGVVIAGIVLWTVV